jgi:cell division protein FtsN
MAQDYARHRDRSGQRSGRRAATRTQPPASTHWNWYIAGVLTGLFAVFVGYVGIANFGGTSNGDAPVQQVVVAEEDLPVFSFYQELANARVDVAAPAVAIPPPAPVTPPPQQQTPPATATSASSTTTTPSASPSEAPAVTTTAPTTPAPTETPPPAAAPPAVATATQASASSADMRQYLLQAGSFQDRQDAESRRARIILLNLNANVVPGVVAGRTWQRVQVGPFNGRQNAEAARALLSENNIDSIPLIVR